MNILSYDKHLPSFVFIITDGQYPVICYNLQYYFIYKFWQATFVAENVTMKKVTFACRPHDIWIFQNNSSPINDSFKTIKFNFSIQFQFSNNFLQIYGLNNETKNFLVFILGGDYMIPF